ncbi:MULTISPECIES: nSTAND1 domain-containing NTPase [Methylosinus]|uniref:Novel STAND NTPase 1 domain-containing protein n=1 Tax=Methylosinus trichosporium (strain ATCC 35070 / NCIMB 11131 / UNIQEM 75 / OB3b) TaxID=595536 RepID=A0A2D2CYN6_METT3|nr:MULTISPECIES: tetratricopeptide repeat protein [Methylosinus]ATQ67861.1 hypothetical protein CQW49_08085 [Methylosinus trichosporium OB3b]OBS50718.1 hypothetical protein A8B73_20200 [Methylosinus sp. 3S-1]
MPKEFESPAAPYESLEKLRADHITMMQVVGRKGHWRDLVPEIRKLIDRVKATGRRLYDPSDREVAQNVISYWASDLFEGDEPGALSAALPQLDAFDSASAPDVSTAPNPYKGLSAFGEADAEQFHGREGAANRLVETLREKPIVLVVGQMGCGKTSFVMAGVVPQLKSAMRREQKNPVLLSFSPGADPFATLLARLHEAAGDDASNERIFQQKKIVEHAPERLHDLLDALFPARPVIFVVDQFEEIFTLGADEQTRAKFASALSKACPGGDDANRAIVIVDKRSEQSALQLPALAPLASGVDARFVLPPLTADETRRIIELPARAIGLRFADGVVDDIVKDIAGDVTALPALQFTLGKLWNDHGRNIVTWDDYDKVGRPHEALQRTAEAIFGALPPDEKEAAKCLFLELVRPNLDGTFIRRRVTRDALTQSARAKEMSSVLERLVEAGLLRFTPGASPQEDRFDLAHEALIDAWPRLRAWLQDDRVASEKKLQFVAMARRWRESGAAASYLLTGDALDEAEAIAGAAPELKEFVKVSKATARDREYRKLRTWRDVALGMLALVIIATIFAILAIINGHQASHERQAALASATKALHSVEETLKVVSSERLRGTITVATAKDLLTPTKEIFAAVEDRPELDALRADVLLEFSNVYYTIGDYEEALTLAEKAKDLAQRHLNADPKSDEWRGKRYKALYRAGDNLAQRKTDKDDHEALQRYRSALDVARVQSSRENLSRAAFIENKMADLYFKKSAFKLAQQHYTESLSLGERFLAEEPSDPEASKMIGDAHERLAEFFAKSGRRSEATDEFKRALEIRERLVETNRENAVYRSNLARTRHEFGKLYQGIEKYDEALQQFEKALYLRRGLVQADPHDKTSRDGLGNVIESIGAVTKFVDPEHARTALNIWSAVVNEHPEQDDWRRSLVAAFIVFGDRWADQQDFSRASSSYGEALEVVNAATDRRRSADDFKLAATAHEKLATIEMKRKEANAAVNDAFAAVRIRVSLLGQAKDNQERTREAAETYEIYGDALKLLAASRSKRRDEEPASAYRNGLRLVEDFMSAHPDSRLESIEIDLRRKLRGIERSDERR